MMARVWGLVFRFFFVFLFTLPFCCCSGKTKGQLHCTIYREQKHQFLESLLSELHFWTNKLKEHLWWLLVPRENCQLWTTLIWTNCTNIRKGTWKNNQEVKQKHSRNIIFLELLRHNAKTHSLYKPKDVVVLVNSIQLQLKSCQQVVDHHLQRVAQNPISKAS